MGQPIEAKRRPDKMHDYIISCCSTADIPIRRFEERDIHYISFHYFINDVMYEDIPGEKSTIDKFYGQLRKGADAKTTQLNADEYIRYFRPFLEQKQDVLHLTLSSGISGTYNSANIARNMLAEEFPDRKIYIVDSLAASSGYGLLADALADKRDEGMDIDTLRDWAVNHRLYVNHCFFSSDLTFYIRGGRISKTMGNIGNLLNICPILCVDAEGKIRFMQKARSKKKAMRQILSIMKDTALDGTEYDHRCYISHSACYGDAKAMAVMIEKAFPNLYGTVRIYDIGTVIGSHTGPGTVAVFYWGKCRETK